MDWELKAHSEPCQTSKMECFAKIVYGFYFCKRVRLRWKLLTIFARRFIFDGWYSPEYVSGTWKYIRWKIGRFSRTSRSIILQSACIYPNHLVSIKITQDTFTGCDQLIKTVQIFYICVLTVSQFTQSLELKQPYRDSP